MKRLLPLAALILLCGCHRPRADAPTPGADGEARAATTAKMLEDLAAADAAAQGPPPFIAPPVRPIVEDAAPANPAEDERAPVREADVPVDPSLNDTVSD